MSEHHTPVISMATESCIVVDDFLPEAAFADVFRFCNAADYTMVHAAKVQKVWRLHDGLPLRGDTFHYRTSGSAPEDAHGYPTGTPLDRFIDALLASMDQVRQMVGRPVSDWQEVTVAPWVYPAGAGLSLHQDTGRSGSGRSFTGSYTFYVNPQWNLHWGGWLLVFAPHDAARTSPSIQPSVSPPWLSDALEAPLVRESSLATAILPAPNRIVFISPRAPHLITRVDQNAGSHARVSLAGFFHHHES